MAWAVPLSQGIISNRGNYTHSQFVIPAFLNALCVRCCLRAVSSFKLTDFLFALHLTQMITVIGWWCFQLLSSFLMEILHPTFQNIKVDLFLVVLVDYRIFAL